MKILVTGTSGHLGGLILKNLKEKNTEHTIVGGSRDSSKGVLVDFDKKETLLQAFAGIDKLFIVSTDSLTVPGLRLKQHINAIHAAKEAGVKHIYYTSLNNPDTQPIFFAPDHLKTEEAIKESGMTYTILRNNWYMENILQTAEHALASKKLITSAGEGRVGFISREDCALMATEILLKDDYKNQILDITNSKTVSYQELAKLLGAEFVNVPPEAMKEGLEAAQLPGFVVDLILGYEKGVALGKFDIKNDLFKKLTGKDAQSVESFFKNNLPSYGK